MTETAANQRYFRYFRKTGNHELSNLVVAYFSSQRASYARELAGKPRGQLVFRD
jgi:hypothetical protein